MGETLTTSLMLFFLTAESEEELKSPLMQVKEESERANLELNIGKKKKKDPVPLLHGK